MQLPNMFHRHGGGTVIDRDRDGVDDRTARDRTAQDRTAQDRTAQDRPERDRPERDRSPAAPAVTAPPAAPAAPAAPHVPAQVPAHAAGTARTSFLATLGLIVGLGATFAALTGRLAPVGIALGVVGLLFALGGVVATARPFVTGRGVAILGVLAALAGIAFGVLAMNGVASWLDSDVNQVDRLRAWLDARLPYVDTW